MFRIWTTIQNFLSLVEKKGWMYAKVLAAAPLDLELDSQNSKLEHVAVATRPETQAW